MTNDEWLRPKALLALISEYRPEWCGKEDKYLRPALVAGIVQVRAKHARLNHGVHRKEDIFTDWQVDPKIWTDRNGGNALDFYAETFTTRASGIGCFSVDLTVLSFNKTQFLDFAGIDVAAVSENEMNVISDLQTVGNDGSRVEESHSVDRGGAPTDATKWRNLVAVVGAVLGNADLIGNDPPKRAALRKIILDDAAKVGLTLGSDGTINPAIDLLIKVAWANHDGQEPLTAADGRPLRSDSNSIK
jgi:hypothetical protein